MNIKIRKAGETDLEGILKLVNELAAFEKAPAEVIVTNDLFHNYWKRQLFEAAVACHGNTICGCAVFFKAYSTWKGLILYLDDLIVTEKYRNLGVGRMLFNHVVKVAHNQDAMQLRWHVLDWNTPAIEFYKQYGAELDPEWITGKLSKADIDSIVQSLSEAK